MKFELNPFFQALGTVLVIMMIVFLLFGSGSMGGKGFDVQLDDAIGGTPVSKIYVAVEGESKVSVIDPAGAVVLRNINLGGFSPHNVQVSPDNKTVWITGNSAAHSHSFIPIESANAETGDVSDEVIVLDPIRDKIIKRIAIKSGIHLAHVVLTPDSRFAYVTAQVEGVIYKIDAGNYAIVKAISTGEGSEPHGLRISPDGRYAYIAMLGNKSLGIVDLRSDSFSEISLGGGAVQTGVTPDGKFAVVSLYDTKQMAVYDISGRTVNYVVLPPTAKGPIQMYPTPDSRFIYLADQGYYFDQPSSEWVYKIDLNLNKVVKEIRAGKAPHGVVVSGDGKFVYVTNLLSGDVSVIGTNEDLEVKRIKVGKEPNGISIWHRNN